MNLSLVRVGQRGLRHWGAVVGAHHALREQKVAKERGHEQVLAEELLEHVAGEAVPGDGVRYRSEDPIELACIANLRCRCHSPIEKGFRNVVNDNFSFALSGFIKICVKLLSDKRQVSHP